MFYPRSVLEKMGFKSLGENVLIDTRTTIDEPHNISLGNNVKIGSFVLLSGEISLGNYVHIASFSALYGSGGIEIGDFISISNYVRLITESDDYSGLSMSAPFVPSKYKFNILKKPIKVSKHCIIGSGSLLLPGGDLAEGVAVGAMSMIDKPTMPWGIYVGIPAYRVKERKKDILALEKEFLKEKESFNGM
ncbi:MAG: acyltransferase [Helicobacter sp.]|nr:acyltransferase [Helicobacter sp.]